MSDKMITKDNIEERKNTLLNDLQTVRERITEYEKKKSEDVALSNALNGAIQQCDIFLEDFLEKEDFNNETPEMAGDDGSDN